MKTVSVFEVPGLGKDIAGILRTRFFAENLTVEDSFPNKDDLFLYRRDGHFRREKGLVRFVGTQIWAGWHARRVEEALRCGKIPYQMSRVFMSQPNFWTLKQPISLDGYEVSHQYRIPVEIK